MLSFYDYFKNKSNYDSLIQLLRNALRHYNTYFRDYKQTLTLSNGDVLKLEYADKNFPHLVGVQTLYFIKECHLFTEFTSSYDAFCYLLTHADEIYDDIMNKKIDPDKLFSKYIFQKIDSVLGMYNISLGNILFVCPYNKELTKFTGTDISIDADYLVFLKNKDYPFSIFGFRRDGIGYSVVTNVGLENNCSGGVSYKKFLDIKRFVIRLD